MTLATASWALALQTFVTTLAAVFVFKKWALHRGWVDAPSGRKIHSQPVATVGGVGILLGMAASFALLFLWSGDALTRRFNVETFAITYREYAHLCLLFLTSGLIVLLGVWDDLFDCTPWTKVFFQTLIAGTFVGFRVTSWYGELQLLYSTVPLDVFVVRFVLFTAWIVLLFNAINLIDGLDGLAAGVVAIASFWLLLANRPMESHFLTWTSAMLLGACVAFLVFNFNPASIFMGDSGALLLGLWVGAGSIEGDFKKISGLILATPLILLTLPLLEVATSTLRRLFGGQRIFEADSRHMHHRLLKLGFRHRSIVLFYYGVTFLLGMLGYLLAPDRFVGEDPIPRIANPEMVFGVLFVIGGAVAMGYTALVSIERRFENAITEITDKYEKGIDVGDRLHDLAGDTEDEAGGILDPPPEKNATP